MSQEELLHAIQAAFRQRAYRFAVHGSQEATADKITLEDVCSAIISEEAEIVEDYPDDARGPSCLILGWTPSGWPLRVVVSYPPDVAVITAYVPDVDR